MRQKQVCHHTLCHHTLMKGFASMHRGLPYGIAMHWCMHGTRRERGPGVPTASRHACQLLCVHLSKELVIIVLLLCSCQIRLREGTYSKCRKHSSRQQ